MVPQITGLAMILPNGMGLVPSFFTAARSICRSSLLTSRSHGTSQIRPPSPISTNITRQSYMPISHAASGVPIAGPSLVPVM